MKKMAALFLALFALSALAQQDQKLYGKWSYYGDEFYSILGGNGKFDRELFNKIFNNIHLSTPGKLDEFADECKGKCYHHIAVGYDRARIIMFGELDVQNDNKGMFVVDVYCGKKFYYNRPEDVSNMATQVNIEHTWPQSRFNKAFNKEMQKSDMHHLFPSDSHANSIRGNNPFGLVGKVDDRLGGEGCNTSRFGFIDSSNVYTPPTIHRGNVARALFYFSMHYNLSIDKNQENILRQWHKEDPVDAAEIKRHEAIAKYQKVRNPFVDHPEIVDRVSDF